MFINTEDIIPKTELRENLTAIMGMVRNEEKTIAISDRGTIIARLSPVSNKKKSTPLSKEELKTYDTTRDPTFGMWKDDPRSDEEILNTLSKGWW